jgi:hypothetical protein
MARLRIADCGMWPTRWSGRRGSNPRPTAWKAVTLPLSYSRDSQFVIRNFATRVGGEGRIRTSEATRATDLQSAAFDRSATSPIPVFSLVFQPASGGSFATCPGGRISCKLFERRCLSTLSLADLASGDAGAGGGIRTPDRLITNQLLYRTELRQPDKDTSLARPVPR